MLKALFSTDKIVNYRNAIIVYKKNYVAIKSYCFFVVVVIVPILIFYYRACNKETIG